MAKSVEPPRELRILGIEVEAQRNDTRGSNDMNHQIDIEFDEGCNNVRAHVIEFDEGCDNVRAHVTFVDTTETGEWYDADHEGFAAMLRRANETMITKGSPQC